MHFGIEIGGLFSRKRCSLRRCLPHEKWNVMYCICSKLVTFYTKAINFSK